MKKKEQSKPYLNCNGWTVLITHTNAHKMDQNLTLERQINLPMGNITSEQQQNGINGNGYEKQLAFSNGLNMSNRDPIDLQFNNITYTVNLGFNKGKHICDGLIFCFALFFLFNFIRTALVYSCNFLFNIENETKKKMSTDANLTENKTRFIFVLAFTVALQLLWACVYWHCTRAWQNHLPI